MIFEEYKEKYGIERARKTFGLSDHMVFTVRLGGNVIGRCGKWVGSEPLASNRNKNWKEAVQRLKDAVLNSFDTFEIHIGNK